jgi:phosphatidylserine/phosphatidylglycerophosphate/cardiolipin synthase-like enzyme
MWEHSKDLVSNSSLVFEASTFRVVDETIVEDPGIHGFFTSDNFKVTYTTFTVNGASRISDELVRAIGAAEERIHIASGHLRSRPVSEALMQKRAEDPEIDIQIYLDGQEYVSDSTNDDQIEARDTCLAQATTESQKRACVDKSFLYGLEVERAGIDVRYKYYAYRWDAGYAAQMHNKFLIIDDALYTGSYNLSDNAEHNTFENMLLFKGPEFADLVEAYEEKFQELRVQGEGLLEPLRQKIDVDATIPIVFPAMSLSWAEVRDLKSLISKECPAVNSAAYRTDPVAHQVCTK